MTGTTVPAINFCEGPRLDPADSPWPARPRRPAGDQRRAERVGVPERRELDHLLRQGGDIPANRRDEQELSVLCLRVLQAAVVYINTLMVQDVLADGLVELDVDDRRGLTPLFWTNVAPYGEVRLNITNRLTLGVGVATTNPAPAGEDDSGQRPAA